MSLQCRSCTSTTSAEYIELISTLDENISYLEYFNQCTQLHAEIGDGLPSSLCTNCTHDLQVSFDFVRMAKQADAALRSNQQLLKLENGELELPFETEEDQEIHNNTNENTIVIEEVMDVQVESLEEVDEADAAEELLECNEDDIMNNEHFVEDTIDVVSLEDINEIDSTEGNLLELLEESQKDIKTIEVGCDNGDYYPEDEVDDEYLIEYDEALTTISNSIQEIGKKWKCVECKRILQGDVSYEGHMNMHKDVRPYLCSLCQCSFRCKVSLQRHFSLRHGDNETSTSCSACNSKFKSAKEFRLHKCRQNNESNESQPLQSKVIEFSDGTVQCPHCGDIVDTDKLPYHVRWEHPNEYRIEPEQQNITQLPNNLNEENGYYVCQFCDERFTALMEMREHMRTNHADRFGKDLSYGGEPIEECKICKKKLLKRNMSKHIENHENPVDRQTPKYICAYCSRECKNLKTLNQHEKMHHGESADVVYLCKDCNRQYNTQNLLEQHRKIAHKERDHVCPICGNAFKLKNQLVNHMKLHLEKNIKCPHCDKKYARHFDLNVHLRTHTGELPFACHLCDKRFAIKVRLTYHLQKHYGVKHTCKECGAEFNSKQKLKAHSFKHTGMPYRCEMCNDHGFANRDVFKRHLLRVHKATMSDDALTEMFQRNTGKTVKIRTIEEIDPELVAASDIIEEIINDNTIKFHSVKSLTDHEVSVHNGEQCSPRNECSFCFKKYFNYWQLKDHIGRVHLPKKTLKCSVCGNTYKDQSQLANHRRLHRDLQYKCTFCNKAYPRAADLRVHMRSHTGETPFICEICGKGFKVRCHLTEHLRKHNGLKVKCKYCVGEFSDSKSLRKHIRKAHLGVPYRCEICTDVGYVERKRFSDHMRGKHNCILTDEELDSLYAKNTGRVKYFKNIPKNPLT